MRTKALCLLLLLALCSVPSFAEPAPKITLADIYSPTPAPAETAAAFPDIVQAFACVPCSSNAYCQTLCECTAAVCTFNSFCQKKICNCTVCP
ncbi:MAG TPA: hypothetical protein VFR31_06465 [Thermoanaerobaculia bacterium]|nr:hypothetical protein [Thermoanaerobaculia bacterium]